MRSNISIKVRHAIVSGSPARDTQGRDLASSRQPPSRVCQASRRLPPPAVGRRVLQSKIVRALDVETADAISFCAFFVKRYLTEGSHGLRTGVFTLRTVTPAMHETKGMILYHSRREIASRGALTKCGQQPCCMRARKIHQHYKSAGEQ